MVSEGLFSDCRARWLDGLCPCCGAKPGPWIDGTEIGMIAEGVMICGRCVAMCHMSDGFQELMLTALLP